MDQRGGHWRIVKDYYAILGLQPDCEPEEIKTAYRSLVQVHHPDLNPEDESATEQFLEVKEAYELLSDPNLREEYDLEYVEAFPEYELEEEEEYWEENPPAVMPIVHDEESSGITRILMLLLLPVLGGSLAWIFSGMVILAIIGTIGGFALALWLGSMMSD